MRMRRVISDSRLQDKRLAPPANVHLPPLQQSMPDVKVGPGFSFRRGEKALQEARDRKAAKQDASVHDLPLKELQGMPVLDAFRHMLIARLGSLPQAYRYLDANDNGNLSYTEFETGLRAMQVDWSSITGKSISALFKALDQNGSGDLSLEELLGYIPVGQEQAGTQQQWYRYCNQTAELMMKAQCSRNPRSLAEGAQERRIAEALDWFEEDRKHHERREKLRRQLRECGDRGPSQTSKRDLVVEKKYRHIRDTEQVKRIVKVDSERTESHVRKIQTVIRDCTRSRKQVVDMQKVLTGCTGETKPKEPSRKDLAAAALFETPALANRTGSKSKVVRPPEEQSQVGQSHENQHDHVIDEGLEGFVHKLAHKHDADPSADEMMHFFEVELTEDEKTMRRLAKEYHVDVCSAEEIKAHFDEIDVNKGGSIDQEEFALLMKKLCKGAMPRDALIKEWWDTLDKDGSKVATFEEFFSFWMTTLKAHSAQFRKTETGTHLKYQRTSTKKVEVFKKYG